MNLSPNDIRNYEFQTQMRGYAKEEVDTFLEQVAQALEAAKQENLKLSMENDSLSTQLSGLKQFEETIKGAAIDARRHADSTVAQAKEEADEILAKAKGEAEKALSSRQQRLEDLGNQLQTAEATKKSYVAKLHELITSHLDIVKDLGEPPTTPEEEKARAEADRIQVTESSEMETGDRETISSQPKGPEAITTEDAKAADKIVEVGPQSGSAEAKQEPAPTPSETEGIDPELAAALERYQQKTEDKLDNLEKTDPGTPRAEAPVEPSPIPEEAASAVVGENGSTGKVEVPAATTADGKPMPPTHLAEKLDEVVAKFEEEMDKAAQT